MPAARPILVTPALALVLVLTGCRATPSPPVDAVAGAANTAAAARLLAARSAAVLADDRAALESTLAADADAGAAALGQSASTLPFSTFSYRIQVTTPGPSAGELTVRALLSYRLTADPDDLPAATALRLLRLVADPAHAGALLVRSEQPVGAWLPWDAGAVGWTSGGGSAVLDVRRGAHDDGALLAGASRAAAAVTAVWGTGWRRVPVLVATDGGAQLAHLTGRDPASVSGLVAVTTPDRVYVDVPAWLALTAAGRQVLVSHEVTHLATGAATDPDVPLWLEEGFADYVGFRGSGIPERTAAAALLGPLASGASVPSTFPPDPAFAAGGAVEDRAYAGAWLACRLLAAAVGPRGLVAVYRAAVAGHAGPAANVDAALRAVTGQGTAVWTARWRTSLVSAAAT